DANTGKACTLQLSTTAGNSLTLAFSNISGITTIIAGNLIINPNSSLTNTITFANLTAANNTITGTLTNNGGIVTATAATTGFGSGSAYVHNMDGGIIPTATWNAASLCNITGVVSTAPSAFTGQTFGMFTYSC